MSPSKQQIKEQFKSILKENFNEKKFDEDIKNNKAISLDDLKDYRLEEKEIELPEASNDDKENPNEANMSNDDGLSFKGGFKDGKYTAIGSNGQVLEAKNMDDLNRKVAKSMKMNALKNKREPFCRLRFTGNVPNKEEWQKSFVKNFLNEGVTIAGDLPNSPEFWEQAKQEYLAKEGHTIEQWEHLTRKVPAEYKGMGKNNTVQPKAIENKSQNNQPKKTIPSPAVQAALKNSGR